MVPPSSESRARLLQVRWCTSRKAPESSAMTKPKAPGTPRKPKRSGGQRKPARKRWSKIYGESRAQDHLPVRRSALNLVQAGTTLCILAAITSGMSTASRYDDPRVSSRPNPLPLQDERREIPRPRRVCGSCGAARPKTRSLKSRWPPRYPRRKIRVLDLGCGTKSVLRGLSKLCHPDAVRTPKKKINRRYHYVSLDVEQRWQPDILGSVVHWEQLLRAKNEKYVEEGYWDIIWASPPCAKFSRANTAPSHAEIVESARIVSACLDAIDYLRPHAWFLENSLNALCIHPVMQHLPEPYVVSYCRYGECYRKDTTIWSNISDLDVDRCTNKTPCQWAKTWARHMYTAQGGGVDGRNNGTHRYKAYEVPVQLMSILMAAAIGEVCKGATRSRARTYRARTYSPSRARTCFPCTDIGDGCGDGCGSPG